MNLKKELAYAARRGHLKEVKKFLKNDPGLAKDWAPIMHACFAGHVKVVKELLKRGADPNVMCKTSHRHRPLHRIIEGKSSIPKKPEHVEIVELLLAAGADLSGRGTLYDMTPIVLASHHGQKQFLGPMLRRLLSRDLFTAAALGEVGPVEAILKGNPEAAVQKNSAGYEPIICAAGSKLHQTDPETADGLYRIVELLLENGAHANATFYSRLDWHLPVLYFASGHANNQRITKLLLENGANANDGESIHHCAEFYHPECLELLLEYGGDLNSTEHLAGNTPLLFVLSETGVRSVPWLLEHGADPAVCRAQDQETPLHAAARRGCRNQILQMLIDHGAEVNAKDAAGSTPLALARSKERSRVVEFLRERGGTEQ